MKESEKKFIVPIILFLIGILLHVLSLANWATVEVKRQNIVDTKRPEWEYESSKGYNYNYTYYNKYNSY